MSAITRTERERRVDEAYKRQHSADRRQRIADYKKILATAEGRRFIMWIKAQAKLEEPLRGHECDAHQLSYRAGMHDVVALVFKSLRTHEPELVFKAEMERAKLEADRRAEIDAIYELEVTEEQ